MPEIQKATPTTELLDEIRIKPSHHIRQALIETAHQKGGEELTEEIATKFSTEELLPDYNALQHLEEVHPGSTAEVLDRAHELHQETAENEITNNGKNPFRQASKSILSLFGIKKD